MKVRFYGLYDSVAKEYVRTFQSKSDEVAQRSANYIVREPGFDKIAGRDYVINYLYTFDSESGAVCCEDGIHTIVTLGSALAAFEAEENQKKLLAIAEQQAKGGNTDVDSSVHSKA